MAGNAQTGADARAAAAGRSSGWFGKLARSMGAGLKTIGRAGARLLGRLLRILFAGLKRLLRFVYEWFRGLDLTGKILFIICLILLGLVVYLSFKLGIFWSAPPA